MHSISSPRAPRSSHRRSPSSTHTSSRSSPRHRDGGQQAHQSPYQAQQSPYQAQQSPYAAQQSPFAAQQSPYQSQQSPYAAPQSPHQAQSPYRSQQSPQQERTLPFGGHRPNQPNYEQTTPALVPENLREPGAGPDGGADVFNVDSTAGVLAAAGETYQAPVAPAGRRRFVGGFMSGLRRALGRKDAGDVEREGHVARDPYAYAEGDAGVRMPEPAVVPAGEREYEPVSPGPQTPERYDGAAAAAEVRYATPTPEGRYAAEARYGTPTPGARSPQAHYAPRDAQTPYASPRPDADAQYPSTPRADTQYPADTTYPAAPSRENHERHESSSSASETAHATHEQYDGTTVVHHDMIPPDAYYGSPPYVEPPLGSDYAKLSPPRSDASLGSYLARLARFIARVNALPWIAPERVTVDYVPGRARREYLQQHAHARPGGARRSAMISWYNSNAPQGSLDMLSGGTTFTPLTEFAQARPLAGADPAVAAPVARYPKTAPHLDPDVVYANNRPMAGGGGAEPPPPARSVESAASATPGRPRRVPAPPVSPDLLAAGHGHHEPRYPNGGYVPYEHQPVPMGQVYAASSVGSSVRAPRP
ncbi:hypothetical protein B0H15DRAFT_810827 [Mycena belliarum]|uniref:Uncharacterized protein n=1 Tax=Mycena belliarum TaxID=1033014 RepID=A0AAD6XXF5_9AGAR|nr:hypothetical protein B0H15DRAFT_810827 [Mycena belliae]